MTRLILCGVARCHWTCDNWFFLYVLATLGKLFGEKMNSTGEREAEGNRGGGAEREGIKRRKDLEESVPKLDILDMDMLGLKQKANTMLAARPSACHYIRTSLLEMVHHFEFHIVTLLFQKHFSINILCPDLRSRQCRQDSPWFLRCTIRGNDEGFISDFGLKWTKRNLCHHLWCTVSHAVSLCLKCVASKPDNPNDTFV